jgi:hypothetical protein
MGTSQTPDRDRDANERTTDQEPAREFDQDPGPDRAARSATERDERTGRAAAAQRMQSQHQWVDLQIKEAMARGDFDDLPGTGKPIKNLGTQHDPDWWIKQLIEREKISGVLPPALQLRKDDAELDERLDRHTAESEVRRILEEFNARVIKARYTPVDGPPLITMPRDVESEVDAWRERRMDRRREAAARRTATQRTPPASSESPASQGPQGSPRRRRWWHRRGD